MTKIRVKASRMLPPLVLVTSVMDIMPLFCAYEAAIGTYEEN